MLAYKCTGKLLNYRKEQNKIVHLLWCSLHLRRRRSERGHDFTRRRRSERGDHFTRRRGFFLSSSVFTATVTVIAGDAVAAGTAGAA
jgi:hypothetical protein